MPIIFCVKCDAQRDTMPCSCGCKVSAVNPRAVVVELVEKNLAIVPFIVNKRVAPRFTARELRFIGGTDEIISMGRIVLLRAAQLYRPIISPKTGTPVKFVTYAAASLERSLPAKVRQKINGWGTTFDDAEILDELVADDRLPVDQAADANEQAAHLHDAIAGLPERHAEVIRLRHFRGKKFVEIAAKLGITHQRAKQIERRALEKLADALL